MDYHLRLLSAIRFDNRMSDSLITKMKILYVLLEKTQ